MQRNSFYFSGGPYQQLLQGMHDALSMPEAFIKLMGPAHTGKTTLCDKLVQYMRRKGFRVVHFDYAIESPEMLRTMLARELDLPNLANFARVLEDALIDDHDKPLLLIFDDAHLLSDISLIEVYRLAEVQTGSRRMLNIVLCGDTSLESRLLSNSEFKSLLLHVSHKFYLEPMDPETLSLFFVTYLEKAGMPGIQLEPKAMNYFYKSCKG
ncbi:MAG: ATP-binding protein, partial [Gammaproteobacteria bacterium]|nr:ATP-binding protein [Gammaproteobacteria bacterium]